MRSQFICGVLAVAIVAGNASVLPSGEPSPSAGVESQIVPKHVQQLARTIAAYETLKRHAELWESNPNFRTLFREMCDSIVQDADVGVSWTSRHFGLDATRSFVKRNAFEERAMARLRNGSNGQREVWSEDHRQYILAVVAKSDNCAKCHEGTNLAGLAKGAVLGFTSLEFSKDLWR